jgi:hypothetical protein
MKLIKLLFVIAMFLSLSIHVLADSASCEDGRCVNPETDNIWGSRISFKPVYKNQYEINLLKIDNSCEDESLVAADKVKLPKNSFFKKTLDNDAQTSNEMLVHVYELDQVSDGNDSTNDNDYTINKYFSAPYKVCLNGKHRVQKSMYKRVGGVNTGVLVVPFKLRDGDLYSDSTIGPYISYKWEVIEVMLTAGLSQISVSEIGNEEIESETGLTAAAGINFEIDKNWDVAFLFGADHLSGETGDAWKYQDEVWISFGIGFNFTR